MKFVVKMAIAWFKYYLFDSFFDTKTLADHNNFF